MIFIITYFPKEAVQATRSILIKTQMHQLIKKEEGGQRAKTLPPAPEKDEEEEIERLHRCFHFQDGDV